jgi:hypothetical protein
VAFLGAAAGEQPSELGLVLDDQDPHRRSSSRLAMKMR